MTGVRSQGDLTYNKETWSAYPPEADALTTDNVEADEDVRLARRKVGVTAGLFLFGIA
jgi:hypothetical protein